MGFIERRQVEDSEIHARALAREIKAQLKLSVHPRSIRTRPGAEKKTRILPRDERAPAALLTYEQMRAEVLNGQARPDGLAAMVYHGMIRGLAVILSEPTPEARSSPSKYRFRSGVTRSGALRLIANMVFAVTITGDACLLSSIERCAPNTCAAMPSFM